MTKGARAAKTLGEDLAKWLDPKKAASHFNALAIWCDEIPVLIEALPESPDRDQGIAKLLEAKACFLRAEEREWTKRGTAQ